MRLNDVTLREGDQMPGRSYTAAQKIECGHALDSLGVEYIQPGFPATGEKDQAVVAELADTTDAEIVALARALTRDVDAALDSNADVVEIFVSVSDRHLEHLLGKTRAEMLEMVSETVDYVCAHGGTPHVTLADAFRTDCEDLVEVFETVPEAQFVTLADSVGARTPRSVQTYLETLTDDIDLSRVGVHFHDDMGCGTANALTAFDAGVGKADVSVASLGERAGNSALEEVVAAATIEYEDTLGVNESELVPVCREVLEVLDESYDDRKAILGEEISEHESGIHTAAMLSDPATLEPFDPERFGGTRRLVFGAATGKGGSQKLLERANVDADDETVLAFQDLLAERGPLELDEAIELARDEFGE